MSAETGSRRTGGRVVLDGVPRVGFYFDMQQHADTKPRCPEDVCFPSVMRACLEYLGDGLGCRQVGVWNKDWRLGCGYAYLMGTTGVAFRLNWKPGWHGDNVASFLVSDDPSEIFRRGFASVGYECEIVCKSQVGQNSESLFRQKIIESIRDKGRPVIAHGVIGPPEECIVAGYDEGGDVLVGWNFFQGSPDCNAGAEFEPNGGSCNTAVSAAGAAASCRRGGGQDARHDSQRDAGVTSANPRVHSIALRGLTNGGRRITLIAVRCGRRTSLPT